MEEKLKEYSNAVLIQNSFGESSMLFLLCGDFWMIFLGLFTLALQMSSLLLINGAFDEPNEDCQKKDIFGQPIATEPDHSITRATVVMSIFILMWVSHDLAGIIFCAREAYSNFNISSHSLAEKGDSRLHFLWKGFQHTFVALAVMAVDGTAVSVAIMHAFTEACEGGAPTIILESVTVLLVLDIDEKIFGLVKSWNPVAIVEHVDEAMSNASEHEKDIIDAQQTEAV